MANFCGNCGAQLAISVKFCGNCGVETNPVDPPQATSESSHRLPPDNKNSQITEPQQTHVSVTAYFESEDAKNKIKKNVDYYKKNWAATFAIYGNQNINEFDPKNINLGTVKGWNWAGFFFSIFWGLWRGVSYAWTLFGVIVFFQLMSFAYPDHVYDKISNFIALPLSFVYAYFGNGLYLQTLIKKRNDEVSTAAPSFARVFIALAIEIVIIIGAVAA